MDRVASREADMVTNLDPRTREFYRRVLTLMEGWEIPFLIGGAYAFQVYTGIERHTKDFDLFVRPVDVDQVLGRFDVAGYRTELTHPHWLGKVYHGDARVDLIFCSGNGLSKVDDGWFEHAVAGKVFDRPVRLCPVEETIWVKAYIMERERFDGADVAHLLRARGEGLDWPRLLRRFGPDWRVLLSHLVLFGFIYPGERAKIPDTVMRDLLQRLQNEGIEAPAGDERVCRGTLLSRSQYLDDLEHWGYKDARLSPRGPMSAEEITHWTEAIEVDGSY
jgi:hypothetical protein